MVFRRLTNSNATNSATATRRGSSNVGGGKFNDDESECGLLHRKDDDDDSDDDNNDDDGDNVSRYGSNSVAVSQAFAPLDLFELDRSISGRNNNNNNIQQRRSSSFLLDDDENDSGSLPFEMQQELNHFGNLLNSFAINGNSNNHPIGTGGGGGLNFPPDLQSQQIPTSSSSTTKKWISPTKEKKKLNLLQRNILNIGLPMNGGGSVAQADDTSYHTETTNNNDVKTKKNKYSNKNTSPTLLSSTHIKNKAPSSAATIKSETVLSSSSPIVKLQNKINSMSRNKLTKSNHNYNERDKNIDDDDDGNESFFDLPEHSQQQHHYAPTSRVPLSMQQQLQPSLSKYPDRDSPTTSHPKPPPQRPQYSSPTRRLQPQPFQHSPNKHGSPQSNSGKKHFSSPNQNKTGSPNRNKPNSPKSQKNSPTNGNNSISNIIPPTPTHHAANYLSIVHGDWSKIEKDPIIFSPDGKKRMTVMIQPHQQKVKRVPGKKKEKDVMSSDDDDGGDFDSSASSDSSSSHTRNTKESMLLSDDELDLFEINDDDDSTDDEKVTNDSFPQPNNNNGVEETTNEFRRKQVSRMTSGQLRKWDGFRIEVAQLVKQAMPDNVHQVDQLMKQFAGREAELIQTLQTMRSRQETTLCNHKKKQSIHRSRGVISTTGKDSIRRTGMVRDYKHIDAIARIAAASTLDDQTRAVKPEYVVDNNGDGDDDDDQSFWQSKALSLSSHSIDELEEDYDDEDDEEEDDPSELYSDEEEDEDEDDDYEDDEQGDSYYVDGEDDEYESDSFRNDDDEQVEIDEDDDDDDEDYDRYAQQQRKNNVSVPSWNRR